MGRLSGSGAMTIKASKAKVDTGRHLTGLVTFHSHSTARTLQRMPTEVIATEAEGREEVVEDEEGEQQVPTPTPTHTAPSLAERQKPEPIAVTKAVQSPPPPSPAAPYSYTYLNDDTVQGWANAGRASVLGAGQKAVRDKDITELGVLFQELIRASLDRRLDAVRAGSLIKEIVTIEGADEASLPWMSPASAFLDNVAIAEYRDSNLPSLKALLAASEISAQRMRVEFDVDFLIKVGLVRDTFNQMRARHQTNLLYRQSNYNLLREETEGYSKLVTELFTSSGGEPPNPPEVTRTYERVRSMIGTFDLDIGRVLDIHLDVFAAVLVRHYRYFVKYLRISSWWPEQLHLDNLNGSELSFKSLPAWALPAHSGYYSPSEDERIALSHARTKRDTAFWNKARTTGTKAFFELGGSSVDIEQMGEHVRGEGAERDERRAWAEATGLQPSPGNKVAAQILGFKLRFYSSDARSTNDALPANLIHLAALLIKIGFISLVDLYPHLWPYDDDMARVKEQKVKEKQEREMSQRPGGGRLNALAAAGSLGDEPGAASASSRIRDTASKTAANTDSKADDSKMEGDETKPELPEAADQKVQLLKSLLCIGALPEALYILGRFPWLMDGYPELPEYIHRILHHCLSKVYEDAHSVGNIHEAQTSEQAPDLDQSGVAKGSLRLSTQSTPKVLRWPQPDKYDADSAVEYKFYWEDWNDNIPICQTVDDFFTLCGTLMNLSGVKLGHDSTLLSKIARVGRRSLSTDDSESNKKRWMYLSKRLIVPALSLTKNNSGAVAEVWDLIKQFSLPIRYNMYAEWFTGQTSRLEDIRSAFDLTRAETKDVLKRISKTNMKSMARALSKISTSSPGVVFSVALNQIESYENLIDVIVECARYFTFLSYDILTWTLMSSLGASGRDRVQADGMLRSKWLNALATFSGKVFKRYSVMNPSPILQYVANQLSKGNTTDLIVLEELTGSMAGIVSDATFNDAQVVAMGGGPLLQGQVMLQLLDRRHEAAMKPTSRRLMKSLIEPRLIGPLLVSMAQEWQTCIYRVPEELANLKVLANLFDESHRVLVQYLDLLRSNLSMKEFNALVPSFTELIETYGLEPQIAFWISRESIAAEMAEHDKRVACEKKEQIQSQTEPDVKDESKDDEMKDAPEQQLVSLEEASRGEADTSMKESSTTSAPDLTEPEQPWHPVLTSLMEKTASVLPENTWSILNQKFFFSFWQLSLDDIGVPMSSYDDENNRLKRRVMAVNSDRSDLTSRGKEKKDDEKKSITDLQSRLQTEMGVRIAAYQRTKQRINKEKDLWFAECRGKWNDLNVAILEHCFIPRIRLSAVDALYTFKILKHLHSVGTKNFRTVGLLDQFFNSKRLSALIYICTAREAENLGKFINELIKELTRWHGDKAVYEKEAYGSKKDLPGFKAKTGDKDVSGLMDFESFRRILGKWHDNLHTALKSSLSGGEYMHIRNAINILKIISANFPVINWMGQNELSIVTDLGKSEKREDLKLSAMSLLGSLKRREKSWIMPQAFMLSTGKPVANQGRALSRGLSPAVGDTSEADNRKAQDAPEPDAKVMGSTESALPSNTSAPTQSRAQASKVNGADEATLSQPASANTETPPTASKAVTSTASNEPELEPVSQQQMPPPAAPEKQAPNGSAPTRPGVKSTASLSRPGSAPGSAPPTPPSDQSDSSGVHPDRLRAITGLPPRPGVTSTSAPAGAKAPHSSQPPSPMTRNGGPPTSDSQRRRFAAVNNILQQPNQVSGPERGQGANIRGQASRPNSLPHPPAASTPPSRYGPPNNANLPPRPEAQASRKELFANHSASNSGFRDDQRHSERDPERRSTRSRDTRSASPHRPSGYDASHPPPTRDDNTRFLRSREEPSRPREDLRDTRGRPPPATVPERDTRRPLPREEPSAAYPQTSRDTRRGPPRDDHTGERERHPAPRSGPLPPEHEDSRSLRSRDEPARRNEPESRDLRSRAAPPNLQPERDTRRVPPSRDDHTDRDRYGPPRSAPPLREDHPADARERERYPPSNPRSGPPPNHEDVSGAASGAASAVSRSLRHRDEPPGRREADMRDLRSRPGPGPAVMDREPPRRGPPLRDDHGRSGHSGHVEAPSERELRDRRPPPSGSATGPREPNWGHDRMPPDRGHPRDARPDPAYHGRGESQGHRRDGGPMLDGRGPGGPMDARGLPGVSVGMEVGGGGRKRGRGAVEDGYSEQKRTRR